jgi:hypothetical protein
VADPEDLRGGVRAPRRFIDWKFFFRYSQGVQLAKTTDIHISTPLFTLPLQAIPAGTPPVSLPQRTLLRHLTWEMPSGQAIAQAMGVTPLEDSAFAELAPLGVGLESNTPLWYYVLKEAQTLNRGFHLGPVGGRIVGEVIIGLLQLDPKSYVAAEPTWRPTLPSQVAGEFRMKDLLNFAKVDPASRGTLSA